MSERDQKDRKPRVLTPASQRPISLNGVIDPHSGRNDVTPGRRIHKLCVHDIIEPHASNMCVC